MRLWVRIFALSALVSCAAVSTVGILALRGGYRGVLEAAISSLQRSSDEEAGLVARAWEASTRLGRASPQDARSAAQDMVSLAVFLRRTAGTMAAPIVDTEVRSGTGEILLSKGLYFNGEAPGSRAELGVALRGGSAWVIRRRDSIPVLFLASAAIIDGDSIIISVAAPVSQLDAFWDAELPVVVIGASVTALILLGVSYLGSRAIARRLEGLARTAKAVEAGSFAIAPGSSGGEQDEFAMVSRSLERMARAVQATMNNLRAEKEDRQRFIDSLTHELKTPVSSIEGFAKLLAARSWDPEVFARGLASIVRETSRIRDLMEALNRLLVARSYGAAAREVSVAELLQDTERSLRGEAADRSVHIEIDAPSGGVSADPALLGAALRNLAANAIRVSSGGMRVTLGCLLTDTTCEVSVRDHGPGMTERELEHAGEPFFRGSSRSDNGHGLGLALCREVAAHLGGELQLANHPEGGLIATLRIPRLQKVYGGDMAR